MKKKIRSVLLIDDDEPTNFINKKILTSSGLTETIHTVQSGQQAIDLLSGKDGQTKSFPYPDLIFLDINMPAMDGWEFLAQYEKLKNEQKAKIVIVMLTTSLNADDESKSRDVKAICDFRNKPLTKQIIEEIVDKYF